MTQSQQMSTDPIVDMDDTTGSNGGSAEDRFSGQSDSTGDDEKGQTTKPNRARSDTARVDGIGISGGTGDADSGQSGGRSSY